MARIPYADPGRASGETREALEALPPLNIFRMLANADTAFVPFVRFAGTLLTQLQLDPELRELAILLTAARTGAEYEWIQHEGIARAMGIADERIEAIRREDIGAGCFDEATRAALRFVSEVLAGPEASEETFASLREHLPDRDVVELLLVVGTYQMLARVMTATGLDLDEPLGAMLVDESRRRLGE